MTARTTRKQVVRSPRRSQLLTRLPTRPASGRTLGAVKRRLGTPIQVVVAIIVVWLVLRPLVYVVWGAFRSASPGTPGATYSLDPVAATYGELLTGGRFTAAVVTTLSLSSVVAICALALGALIAWLLVRTDVPGKPYIRYGTLIPIFYSSLVGIIGWEFLLADRSGLINVAWADLTGATTALLSIYSFAGVAFVMTLHYTPYVLLVLLGPMTRMGGAFEEAAAMSGASRWTTLRTVTLPMLTPAVGAAGLFVFVLASEMFSVPVVLGGRSGMQTLSIWIYSNVRGLDRDLPSAAAAGVLLLVVAAIMLFAYRRLLGRTGRYVAVGGKAEPAQPIPLGRLRFPISAACAVFVTMTTVLPLAAVIVRSLVDLRGLGLVRSNLGLQAYRHLLSDPALTEAVTNTLILSGGGASIALAIGMLVGVWKVRWSNWSVAIADFGLTLPVAIPGILAGLGFLWAYVASPLYLTLSLLMIVVVARFVGISVQSTSSGLLQIDRSLEEAGAMSGASRASVTGTITLPLMRPVLLSVWLLMALSIARELSASVLLYGIGSRTLPILTWIEMTNGFFGEAAAVSIIQVGLLTIVILAWRLVGRGDVGSVVSRA